MNRTENRIKYGSGPNAVPRLNEVIADVVEALIDDVTPDKADEVGHTAAGALEDLANTHGLYSPPYFDKTE